MHHPRKMLTTNLQEAPEGQGIANTRQDEHARRMMRTHRNSSSNSKFNTGGSPILGTKSDAQFRAKYLYPHCGGTAVWPQKVVQKNEPFLGSRNHLDETLSLASHTDLQTRRHDHQSPCKNCSIKHRRLFPECLEVPICMTLETTERHTATTMMLPNTDQTDEQETCPKQFMCAWPTHTPMRN